MSKKVYVDRDGEWIGCSAKDIAKDIKDSLKKKGKQLSLEGDEMPNIDKPMFYAHVIADERYEYDVYVEASNIAEAEQLIRDGKGYIRRTRHQYTHWRDVTEIKGVERPPKIESCGGRPARDTEGEGVD